MSSTTAKVIAAIAVLLTIVLAFVGYKVSRQYAETSVQATQQAQVQAQQPQTPKTLAVVALKPLAAYKAIGKDDVSLVEVAVVPQDYFTNLDDVVGKQPLVDVDVGAPVTGRYFKESNILSRAIPPGFQAVSVEISDVISVGGFVRPGDIVDVLLYLKKNSEIKDDQARVLLKDVRVLAYQEMIVDRPEGLAEEEKGQSRTKVNRTAVLAVPEADTTRLMLGDSLGELRLALHGQTPPGVEQGAAPDTVVASGLPISDKALAEIKDRKVPDKAYTAQQLGRIAPPPALQRQTAPVYVYRGSEVEKVAVSR